MENYMEQTKLKIQKQVERFRELGLSDKEIIHWVENELNSRIGLANYFETVEEVAEFLKLPTVHFQLTWTR